MTWVKICGLTNWDDAELVASSGANALGFIFAASKRQISPQKAKEIISYLPRDLEKVGVFMDQDSREVRKIAEYCSLTGLQFHGNEPPQYCKDFKDFTVIKAFRVNTERGWQGIATYIKTKSVDRILLDTYVPGVPGGTGKTFPWNLVNSRKNWEEIPLIIAGGLNPENVAIVIREVKPFGIDVGSGVEREPGKKDEQKIKQFIHEVKKVNSP